MLLNFKGSWTVGPWTVLTFAVCQCALFLFSILGHFYSKLDVLLSLSRPSQSAWSKLGNFFFKVSAQMRGQVDLPMVGETKRKIGGEKEGYK